jgi:hypothetical protein
VQVCRQYGYKFGDGDIIPFTATGLADLATLEALNFFECAAIFDIDSRLWKDLKVGKVFEIRVTSGAAQNLTLVQEMVPGAYAS